MSPSEQRFGALLASPNFRRLWIAAVVLALGDAFMRMGLIEFFRAEGYDVATETAKMAFAVSLPGLLLSAHRTGGTVDALFDIGRMTVADAELILRGLPPQMCRRADPSIAARMRSKPVSVT